jgi:hypothetical protein
MLDFAVVFGLIRRANAGDVRRRRGNKGTASPRRGMVEIIVLPTVGAGGLFISERVIRLSTDCRSPAG